MRHFALGCVIILTSAVSAQAHQCYRRVVEPPRYSTVEEQVMIAPEREVAEYAPAVTRTVEETVVVRPERTVTRYIPAEYAVEDQTVEVEPARREWRTRNEEGELIGCWVNVPARYARVAHRVMVSPAREVEQTIPGETATRLRTVVVEPAHVVTHTIPAQSGVRARTVQTSEGGAYWSRIEQTCE